MLRLEQILTQTTKPTCRELETHQTHVLTVRSQSLLLGGHVVELDAAKLRGVWPEGNPCRAPPKRRPPDRHTAIADERLPFSAQAANAGPSPAIIRRAHRAGRPASLSIALATSKGPERTGASAP